jgi:phosphoserine phosphatase
LQFDEPAQFLNRLLAALRAQPNWLATISGTPKELVISLLHGLG